MKKNKVYTLDAETDPFVFGKFPKPFVWGVYDGSTFYYFEKTDKLINFITNNQGDYYAHNGGKFDFHLDGFIESININEKLMFVGARLLKAKIGRSNIIDSYGILPLPLRLLSSEKSHKKDIDYEKLTIENREKNMPEIIDYLEADVVTLYDAVTKFQSSFGDFLTIATASFNQLEQACETKFKNQNENFYNRFEKFYKGGRVEVFNQGHFECDIEYFDINSSYPNVMLKSHPVGVEYDTFDGRRCDMNMKDYININMQDFIILTCISDGAFCHIDDNYTSSYPTDKETREYHVTGWEYKAALKYELLSDVNISRVIKFKNTINFKKFVDKFYNLRKKTKAGSLLNKFYKLILNSAYGKFAINPANFKDALIIHNSEMLEYANNGFEFTKDIYKDHSIVSKKIAKSKRKYINVATAASITGAARAALLHGLHSIDDDNLLYCDTDSIIFKKQESALGGMESGALGGWSSEGDFESGFILAKKMYSLKIKNKNEYKIASKGVKMRNKDFINLYKKNEFSYKQNAPVFSWKKNNSFLERKIKLK